jgi:hypothetical protein
MPPLPAIDAASPKTARRVVVGMTDLFGESLPEDRPSMMPTGVAGKQEIYTPDELARLIVDHFKPAGRICEPCKGGGAFLRALPKCDWFEIQEGKNFMAAEGQWDWIVTNPPWNEVQNFLIKSMRHADNIVFLCWASAWWTKARQRVIDEHGFAMAEILKVPTPPAPWPQSGFQLAAVCLRRGWRGGCTISSPNSALGNQKAPITAKDHEKGT